MQEPWNSLPTNTALQNETFSTHSTPEGSELLMYTIFLTKADVSEYRLNAHLISTSKLVGYVPIPYSKGKLGTH